MMRLCANIIQSYISYLTFNSASTSTSTLQEPSVAVVFEGLMSFNMTEKFFYSPNTEDSLVNINKGKAIPINDDGSVAPKIGQEETLVKGANEGKDKTK